MKITPIAAEACLCGPFGRTWPFGPRPRRIPRRDRARMRTAAPAAQATPFRAPRLKRSQQGVLARVGQTSAFREGERARVAAWRAGNRDKVRAQKQKARAANYNRPFVAIDSEGQNYPGDDILMDGVRYAQHATYLWGAVADDGRPPHCLSSPKRAASTRSRSARSKSWIGYSTFRSISAAPSSSCSHSAMT